MNCVPIDMLPTQGPLLPTQGPLLPTQGPLLPTQGPLLPTQGPLLPTQGPLLPTQRPLLPTQRPLLPTQRPLLPTQRPLLPTQRPLLPTQRPLLPTQRPLLPTQRPLLPTQHPLLPTQRPLLPTQGPLLPTQCPLLPTQCPLLPTQCPLLPTQGPFAPYTGSIAPYTGSIAPYTVSVAPYTGSIAPYTGSIAPYTGSIAPYTGSIAPYSLSRGNPLKFTSFRNIHSWICAAQRLHARTSVTSYTSVNIYHFNPRLAHFNALWMEYIRSLRTGIMEEYPVMSTSQGTYVRIEQTSEAIRVTYEICRAGGRGLELRTAGLNNNWIFKTTTFCTFSAVSKTYKSRYYLYWKPKQLMYDNGSGVETRISTPYKTNTTGKHKKQLWFQSQTPQGCPGSNWHPGDRDTHQSGVRGRCLCKHSWIGAERSFVSHS